MKTPAALLCLLAMVCGSVPAVAVSVDSFTPEGYARAVRQVQVRFDEDMVALGDPRLADPFTVACTAAGHGRWADSRNWEYDFDADLDAGESCRFTLRAGLKSLAGVAVTGRHSFDFNTGGPVIHNSLPADGSEDVSEDQVFILKLDAAATAASIVAHAWCAIDGVVERVPVQVLEGAQRRDILAQSRQLAYSYYQLLWKDGEVTDARVRNRELTRRESLLTLLRCQRGLPPATQVILHWGTGIAAASGLSTHEDQQLAFRVRPDFTATVECTRTNPRAGCVPTLPISITFSAPVPRDLALKARLVTRAGKAFAAEPERSANAGVPNLESVRFPGPFPEEQPLSVQLPAGLVDDAGRLLANAARFPLSLHVDAAPPLVKFSGEFGILESRTGGVLPVTVRNVERRLAVQRADLPARVLKVDTDAGAIMDWLNRVEAAAAPQGEWRDAGDSTADHPHRIWREMTGNGSVFHGGEKTTTFALKPPESPRPAQVVGIPLGKPGLYVVEIASPILGSALLGPGQVRYVPTAALVTDMAVHLQWGNEASTVWVTQLSTGKPVPNADVVVAEACGGRTLWQGRTDVQGLARIDHSLGLAATGSIECRWSRGLIALARAGDDASFVLSSWTRGIAPSDFSLPAAYGRPANEIYHTVFDRELFRAGETVSMKHFIRRHVLAGMDVPAAAHGTLHVEITHAGSGDHFSQDVSFDAQGIGSSEFRIPDDAKLGVYSITIDRHESGTFTVAQFRLPSMRGALNGPAQTLVNATAVNLDLHVEYLSGGGAAGLPVKIRSLVEPQTQTFAAWPEYTFGGDAVVPGLRSATAPDADADADADADGDSDGATVSDGTATRAQTLPLTLDGSGSARLTLNHLAKSERPARLTAEMEYSDANGQTYTASTSVSLAPASIAVGIATEGWAGSPGQLRFRVLAVDLSGKPLVSQPVQVHLYQVASFSYRKRLIGGFYTYETSTETKLLTPTCNGTTDVHGLLPCSVAPGVSGQIVVRAETRSPEGVVTGATTSMWCLGADELWFGGTSGDRMDLLPEKSEYSSGETARFQVRMPFREATALVTVEREGVIRSFVTTLKGTSPVVDVPIEAIDSPNVFVSVLAVRGRVAHAERAAGSREDAADDVTSLVDLTRPAYRLGMAQIKVNWKPHRLVVRVEPTAATWKVRQTAQVHIHVSAEDGEPLPPGTEIAVAAVDEALLQLKNTDSWNLLGVMMAQRSLEVWTSTAQMQVVGKRHYGRKAVPQGGGGGRETDPARELFDSLLMWKARISVDANGDVTVPVPLNDSLSAFRIVAVAHAGAQKFGTGSATIRTTQDLILLSGLPPLVREADHYTATFTVRNTTDQAIAAHLTASSPALGRREVTRTLRIAPGLSTAVHLNAIAPLGSTAVAWKVAVRADDSDARDALKVSQQLIEAVPVRTYQATLMQLTQPLALPAARPDGAIAGRGGLDITVQDHLAASLDGVREYMSRYPYVCIEQQTSRSIALDDRAMWDQVMRRLPLYLDADGLLRYFPTEWLPGDDSLTAYVLAIANARGWPLPAEAQERMTRALRNFVAGRIVRSSALPTADLAIRKLAAIDALSRYQQATPDMLDSITVEPALLPTSAVLDWIGVLQRLPQVPDADRKIAQGFQILRSRLNFQGTIMTFSTEREDALWWLMVSEDVNASRVVLAAMTQPAWTADIPRLVRGALGRQQFGHWNTTVANAWGVVAMQQFSARFESTPVTGTTDIHYADARRQVSWGTASAVAGAQATVVALPWADGTRDLTVQQSGTGAPWVMVRALAALPLTGPLSSGYHITKTLSAVDRQRPGQWTRGDVLHVTLVLDAQSDMSWVVVEDPVPAGATILGSELSRDGGAWLAFQETRFDSFRAYYRFVPKGRWTVQYTVRLDNPGAFNLPATRVEAMYAPEMFGELPNAKVTVAAQETAP